MKRKLFVVVFALMLVLSLNISVFAEETGTQTSEDWASEVLAVIETHKKGDVNIIYTDDSVVTSGIYTDGTFDVLSKQVLFIIEVDLPAGYVVYDDPSTEYIDGIRLNGQTVTSYRVPIDYTQDVDFELVVRTVYAEGFLGTVAQMSDGTYNWVQLLENPIGLLMAAYYVLATVSVVVGIFAMFRGKNKKVKTADEISTKVHEAADAAATQAIEQKILPIMTAIQGTSQSLVKAFALTTSKSKEAPVALLDVLQTVSNADATAAIEEAKKRIAEDRAKAEAETQRTKELLNNIAHTVQEVSNNENAGTQESEQEVPIF
ncbi:MAG: hypothetical protein J6R62_00110 [Rikenellaceae bacterium]|nr:hypothetical protein [Rikenellaceae bacterium]